MVTAVAATMSGLNCSSFDAEIGFNIGKNHKIEDLDFNAGFFQGRGQIRQAQRRRRIFG